MSRHVAKAVCACCLVGLALAGGCSNPTHEANQRLQEAIRLARRYYDKALGTFSSPVLSAEAATQPGEIDRLGDAAAALGGPDMAVKPGVLADLQTAEKILQDALEANRNAEDSLEGMAETMLSQIAELRAYVRGRSLAAVRRQANEAVRWTREAAAALRARLRLADCCRRVLAVSDQPVTDPTLVGAAARAQELRQQTDALKAEIAALKRTHEQLTAQGWTIMADAEKLLAKGQQTPGEEGLRLLGQAADKRKELIAKNQEMDRNADLQRAKADELAGLVIKARAAEEMAQIAQKIVEDRLSEKAGKAAVLAEVNKGVTSLMGEITLGLRKATAAWKELRVLEDRAMQACREADDLLEKVHLDTQKPGRADLLARHALLRMAMGKLAVEVVLSRASATRLVAEVDEAWQSLPDQPAMPASYDTLHAALSAALPPVMADPAQHFQKAVQLYQEARAGVDAKVQWAYLGNEASAHAALFDVTSDDSERAAALRVLNEALKGCETSPFLMDVRRLRDWLTGHRRQGDFRTLASGARLPAKRAPSQPPPTPAPTPTPGTAPASAPAEGPPAFLRILGRVLSKMGGKEQAPPGSGD